MISVYLLLDYLLLLTLTDFMSIFCSFFITFAPEIKVSSDIA